ncbi:uncharacterized protein Tco025E_07266 [Trypanosoma conorhini]|uniref:Uncharacterized protein n=1 Tax=Trypanosoma conorhini TaxID=83891 RepID=A0A3R7MU43_9TRYP|nr:uncharacterized protein Tco025E_07266 [Trypanosoma conorhini]RNF08156.1 hypothetical protein Tco025E_07266 [Trypanosoma conorhini]
MAAGSCLIRAVRAARRRKAGTARPGGGSKQWRGRRPQGPAWGSEAETQKKKKENAPKEHRSERGVGPQGRKANRAHSTSHIPARECARGCPPPPPRSAGKGSREEKQPQRRTHKQSAGGSAVRKMGHSFPSGVAIAVCGGGACQSPRAAGIGPHEFCRDPAVPSPRLVFRNSFLFTAACRIRVPRGTASAALRRAAARPVFVRSVRLTCLWVPRFPRRGVPQQPGARGRRRAKALRLKGGGGRGGCCPGAGRQKVRPCRPLRCGVCVAAVSGATRAFSFWGARAFFTALAVFLALSVFSAASVRQPLPSHRAISPFLLSLVFRVLCLRRL